jgi:hypothetical protein
MMYVPVEVYVPLPSQVHNIHYIPSHLWMFRLKLAKLDLEFYKL